MSGSAALMHTGPPISTLQTLSKYYAVSVNARSFTRDVVVLEEYQIRKAHTLQLHLKVAETGHGHMIQFHCFVKSDMTYI